MKFISHDIEAEFLTFSGGEEHVQLGAIADKDVLALRAFIRSSSDFMRLLLLGNAIQHHNPNACLDLELPYLPYARQDRVCAAGQAFSLELVGELLKSLPLSRLRVWDCHSMVGVELLDCENISPVDIIRSSRELSSLIERDDSILVCPDKGARGRSQAVADAFSQSETVFCDKVRDPATGRIQSLEIVSGDPEGKVCVITDDICDGGFTFIKVSECLKAAGAKSVVLYVTHGILSKGFEALSGYIDAVYTTQSFENVVHPQVKYIQF